MKKDKFASLIMLGAFSAGVASSSAVSAQGSDDFTSAVDMSSIGSHDESANMESKFNNESKDVSPENRTDSLENLSEENKKNESYLFVGNKFEENEQNKSRNSIVVKSLAGAGIVAALSGAAFGISKLAKSSGNSKKDDPLPDPISDPLLEPEPSLDLFPKPVNIPEPVNIIEEKEEVSTIIFRVLLALFFGLVIVCAIYYKKTASIVTAVFGCYKKQLAN